jgi:hypothetical protein
LFGITVNKIDYISLKDTSDCGITKGCFLYPSSCSGSTCTFIFKYLTVGIYTNFGLYASTASIGSSAYVAIGKC